MARSTWHAYYFDNFDRSSPAARTLVIEADNEEDAGKIAIAQMGRSMRVDVAAPVWGAPHQTAAKARALPRPIWPLSPSPALGRDERQCN